MKRPCIFSEDPIEGCLVSLMGIMRGEKEREFYWYGEPGGERIKIEEIPTNKHMIRFQVEGFSECYGDEIEDFEKGVDIEIKKKQLIRMFYFEFKKISELLKDQEYEENRKGNFPFQRFREFERLAIAYIDLE